MGLSVDDDAPVVRVLAAAPGVRRARLPAALASCAGLLVILLPIPRGAAAPAVRRLRLPGRAAPVLARCCWVAAASGPGLAMVGAAAPVCSFGGQLPLPMVGAGACELATAAP